MCEKEKQQNCECKLIHWWGGFACRTLVKDKYEDARTQARTCVGGAEKFIVKIGLHIGLALNLYLI